MDFDAIIASGVVPDGWQQGRGCFGGLVLAMLVRAAERDVEPGRTLRALNGEIIGPVQPGPVELRVEALRVGSGVSTIDARLLQGGEVQAHAVCVFGKARDTFAAPPGLVAPPSPPWREVPAAPIAPPVAPVFTQHVEMRVIGPALFSGRSDEIAETTGWVRFRRPGVARDGAYTVAMIDCWYPALLATERAPRPVATLTFAFERCAPLDGLDPDAPLLYRGRNLAGADGYAVESRELWGEDGRLVALNQQTIVIMK